LREVHVLDDMVSELKQQKEDLRTRIDRLQADGGTASAKGTYEFKVIEPL
jgi:chaperonin cofactor prefoldin